MAAAIGAAQAGCQVVVYEKNGLEKRYISRERDAAM